MFISFDLTNSFCFYFDQVEVEIDDVFPAWEEIAAHVFDIYYVLFCRVILSNGYGFLLALFGTRVILCVCF